MICTYKYSGPHEETENHTWKFFDFTLSGYMLVGHTIYQINLLSSGNRICVEHCNLACVEHCNLKRDVEMAVP